MKEKVLSLAKGNFTYEPPELILAPGRLEFYVTAGRKTAESFILKNRRGTRMKGFGSVDEPALNFLPVFHDGFNELQMEVDATELIQGEELKGEVHLVTDCGEAALPYHIHVVSPELKDEKGVVSDYNKLRERIQENPEQGAALFHDPEFEEIFLFRDEAGRLLYHHLLKKNTRLQSMEEFLVAMGKKKAIRFYVKHAGSGQKKKIALMYELQGADIQDSLQVRVNTWGSIGIQIRSTHDFIIPEQYQLWTDEFVGSTGVIKFQIRADKVPVGRWYGSLIVESLYEKKEIRICVHNTRGARERKVLRARKAAVALLVRAYLAHQEGLMDKIEYQNMFQKNRTIIQKLSGTREVAVSGYIAVILGDEPEILNFYQRTEHLERPQPGADSQEVENFVFIAYVKYLYTKRDEDRQQISRLLEAYRDNGYQSIPLFLISLHAEERYQIPERRAEAICRQMKQNPGHVLLRSELLQVYLKAPEALTTLDSNILATICYGVRKNLISEEMSLTVSYLAERVSIWNPLLFAVLTGLYEQFEQEDTLRSICELLIRSEKREKRYHSWFARGVERHLRLTELYEYYMYTMDYDSCFYLSDSVISYFQYENHLNDRCKTFLYAYIVKKRNEQPENFRIYGTHIREYALKQLERHRVSRDMAVIYEGLFLEDNIRDSVARELPYIMFNHLLVCRNENMESVVVVHAEMREEMEYPLDNGQAVIQLYTSCYQLYFVDREGHYYTGTIDYQLHKLLHLDEFAMVCFEHGSDYVHLLAHLAVKALRGARLNESQVKVLQRVAEIGCFRDYTQRKLFMRLYDHYQQQKETTLLLELLQEIPTEAVKRERLAEVAATCIYYGVHDGMYDKAERMLSRYGIQDCDKNALVLLVRNRIQRYEGKFVPLLVKWAIYLYYEKCYDREILNYLAGYYMGSTRTLTGIYRKCSELSGDVVEDGTKERLLGQVLFTGSNLLEYEDIFLDYYERGNNRVLVKAFLSEYAYEYLVDRLTLPDEIFVKIEKEAFYVKDTVMVLAAMKYYSTEENLAWKQQEFIERNLEQFVSEGLVMAFMKKFIGRAAVPYEIENTTIIQYCSGTDRGIFLHIKAVGGDYETEAMRKVFDGIYVKELLLFSDEEKICYIEEEETGKKTKEMHVNRKEAEVMVPGFFQMVNEMIEAREHNDTAKYEHLRRQYEKQHAVAAKLFKIQ